MRQAENGKTEFFVVFLKKGTTTGHNHSIPDKMMLPLVKVIKRCPPIGPPTTLDTSLTAHGHSGPERPTAAGTPAVSPEC